MYTSGKIDFRTPPLMVIVRFGWWTSSLPNLAMATRSLAISQRRNFFATILGVAETTKYLYDY